MNSRVTSQGLLLTVAGFACIGVVGFALPQWQFLVSVALSKGIVALGVALLLRTGLASFGQALTYAVGAYCVGFGMNFYGLNDLLALLIIATVVSGLVTWVLGFLLARYRDIFFAMLTLALSMIMYGTLLNNADLGGSDGFNVKAPTIGYGNTRFPIAGTSLFVIVLIAALMCAVAVGLYLRSTPGRLGPAIKDNEIRVEYLGTSARSNIHLAYSIAGALAGLGGALSAFNIGHIDPDMAFWTTSGEFVFIAVLSGTRFAFAPFLGALLLEIARAAAYRYAPNAWQIVMGIIMLSIIAFLPGGLSSFRFARRSRSTGSHGCTPKQSTAPRSKDIAV
ncbi:branched-chain amino acid ABC transporter permease [Paraburkholderia bengalensis]|uniref:Branched-chain amino acid ABC transporter permease n=1 Tax=Paraburkholderia bengalensis TaxID=2747562 RepID=A0ABU8J3N5_9BURK